MFSIPHESAVAKLGQSDSLSATVELNSRFVRSTTFVLSAVFVLAMVGFVAAAAVPSMVALVFEFSWFAFLLAGAFFLAWQLRAYRNLALLDIRNLQYKPRWVLFGFFIPIANFYVPKQLTDDLWCASLPTPNVLGGSTKWQHLNAPSWIAFWWSAILIFMYAVPILSLSDRVPIQLIAGLSCLSLAAISALSLKLIRAIEQRQGIAIGNVLLTDGKMQNRAICPLCKARLRTDRAKQCPSCLLDWHNFEKLKFLGGPRANVGRSLRNDMVLLSSPSSRRIETVNAKQLQSAEVGADA